MARQPQTQTNTGAPSPDDRAAYNEYIQSRVAGQATTPSITGGSIEDPFMPPARKTYDPIKKSFYMYDGPGLVTKSGRLLLDKDGKPYYYSESSAEQILFSASAAGRAEIIQKLLDAGYMSRSQVGDSRAEINALYSAMMTANFNGLEVKHALDKITSGRPVSVNRGGPVRTYSKTSSQDLARTVKAVSANTIGREISDEEAMQFAQQYQQQEVAYQRSAYAGGTVTEPPSLETAATQFVQRTQPKEESAYRYLGYMNKLFSSIGAI